MTEDKSMDDLRWEDMEGFLEAAVADDLRPFARAWLVHQCKSEIVSYGLTPEQRRVEALRAAAAVSGSVIHEATEQLGEPPNTTQAEEYTLKIASAFVRWLETGR